MDDLTPRELLVSLVATALIGLASGSIVAWGSGAADPAEILFFEAVSALSLVLSSVLAPAAFGSFRRASRGTIRRVPARA